MKESSNRRREFGPVIRLGVLTPGRWTLFSDLSHGRNMKLLAQAVVTGTGFTGVLALSPLTLISFPWDRFNPASRIIMITYLLSLLAFTAGIAWMRSGDKEPQTEDENES